MVTITLPDGAQIGSPASFGATTDIKRPYRWQWFRNGKEVPGASSACVYRTWPLRPEDFEAQYHVQVFGLFGDIEESAPVKLSSVFGKPTITRSDPVPAIINLAGAEYKVINVSGDIVTLQKVPSGAVPPTVQSTPVDHVPAPSVTPVPVALQTVPGTTPAQEVPVATPDPVVTPETTPAPEPAPAPAPVTPEPTPAPADPTPTPGGTV